METISKARILVVDDDVVTLKVVSQMLKSLGYEATAAQDGAKALNLMITHDGFQLVLTDINMPKMDGWELARRIKAINAFIPIVALTGEIPNLILPQLNASGISHALFKPLNIYQLKETLALVLDPERLTHAGSQSSDGTE